jgi:integrase/recombinase XerD
VDLRVRDECERAVVELWRRGHLCWSTIRAYLAWVRRFRTYCQDRQLVETDQLSSAGVLRFTRFSARPRLKSNLRSRRTCESAQGALHAWSCALRTLGETVPEWRPRVEKPLLHPLMIEYGEYRRAHNGVADSTLVRDLDVAKRFLKHLRQRRRTLVRIGLVDIDIFVAHRASHVSKSSVVDICSSLRAFLRFLQTTGRLDSDLARGVMAPRFHPSARPPRVLPWQDVKRILRSVPQAVPPGKRDFAMLLLMAAYGLGAAEVLSLRLEDVDWQAGVLKARRPKTNVHIELPLLPAVARALAAYLRCERPPAKGTARIFLRKKMPYLPLTSAAIRYRIRHYAARAGVTAKVIGAHAFRHSHASRQVDTGANLKVVSDILGHRSASSTSIYVRVAMKRLRSIGLPVPR